MTPSQKCALLEAIGDGAASAAHRLVDVSWPAHHRVLHAILDLAYTLGRVEMLRRGEYLLEVVGSGLVPLLNGLQFINAGLTQATAVKLEGGGPVTEDELTILAATLATTAAAFHEAAASAASEAIAHRRRN